MLTASVRNVSNWQRVEPGLRGLPTLTQYRPAHLCSPLEKSVFVVYHHFRHRVNPFANFRNVEDTEECS
jgi:hypothetical protein